MSTGYWTYDKGQSKGKGKGKGKDIDIAEDTEEKGKGNGKGTDKGKDSDVAEGTDFKGMRQLFAPWRHEANTWSLWNIANAFETVSKAFQVSLNALFVMISKHSKN